MPLMAEMQTLGLTGTGSHPFSLEVNGSDVIALSDVSTIKIAMPGPGTNGSLSATLTDASSAITVNAWDEIRLVEHAATRPNLFGGFVQSPATTVWAAGGRDIVIDAVGYGVLLDKKAVDLQPDPYPGSYSGPIEFATAIASLINRFGGIIHGYAQVDTDRNSYTSDPTFCIPNFSDWEPSSFGALASMPLRAGLEQWLRTGLDSNTATAVAGLPVPTVGALYWVDSYARLHAHPQLADGALNAYDGTCPIAIAETTGAGLVRASSLTYAVYGADIITAAYVEGGNAAGTGFTYGESYPVAGDLVGLFTHPESTSASLLSFYGGGDVAAANAATIAGEAVIESDTPLDIRPGQRLLITSTQLGLSSTPFLIGGVSIVITKPSHHIYTVSFGGRQRRSLARRLGTFQSRRRVA